VRRTNRDAIEQQTDEVCLAIDRLADQIGTTGFQIASAINRLASAIVPMDRVQEVHDTAIRIRKG